MVMLWLHYGYAVAAAMAAASVRREQTRLQPLWLLRSPSRLSAHASPTMGSVNSEDSGDGKTTGITDRISETSSVLFCNNEVGTLHITFEHQQLLLLGFPMWSPEGRLENWRRGEGHSLTFVFPVPTSNTLAALSEEAVNFYRIVWIVFSRRALQFYGLSGWGQEERLEMEKY